MPSTRSAPLRGAVVTANMVASCVSTASPVPVTKSFTTEGKLSTPGSRNSLEKNMQEMQMVQQETQQLVQSVEEFALALSASEEASQQLLDRVVRFESLAASPQSAEVFSTAEVTY